MIDENLKMRVTPEESKIVQNLCFSWGCLWAKGSNIVKDTDKPFLYINKGDRRDFLRFGESSDKFDLSPHKEITYKEFCERYGPKVSEKEEAHSDRPVVLRSDGKIVYADEIKNVAIKDEYILSEKSKKFWQDRQDEYERSQIEETQDKDAERIKKASEGLGNIFNTDDAILLVNGK